MYHISEAIVVEGLYDKIKLSRFIDGLIFVTNGFQVFSNNNMIETLKNIASKTGIVILTDSDQAGFKIRNYIKQALPKEQVKHAYIPTVAGKERRKVKAGKEGLLGVEGIAENVILEALKASGCHIDGSQKKISKGREITKSDLYTLGLSGIEGSMELRQELSRQLGIPIRISANMLIDVLNRLLDYEEFHDIVVDLKISKI